MSFTTREGVEYNDAQTILLQCPHEYNGHLEILPTVTHIDAFACRGCEKLKSVFIPDSVAIIGNGAFAGCKLLTHIHIPMNAKIYPSALDGCTSLTNIEVDENNPHHTSISGNLYSKDRSALLKYAAGKRNPFYVAPKDTVRIDVGAFYAAQNLEIVHIENVLFINSFAFNQCPKLEYVFLSDKIEAIHRYTFYQCAYLKQIDIPHGVKHIGDNAFFGCKSLKIITVPDSVSYIGIEAFGDCSQLKAVYLPASVEMLEPICRYSNPKLRFYCEGMFGKRWHEQWNQPNPKSRKELSTTYNVPREWWNKFILKTT